MWLDRHSGRNCECDAALALCQLVVPRHGFSWERGRFSGALFRGNWRVGYGAI
jgi:hypothetical protein